MTPRRGIGAGVLGPRPLCYQCWWRCHRVWGRCPHCSRQNHLYNDLILAEARRSSCIRRHLSLSLTSYLPLYTVSTSFRSVGVICFRGWMHMHSHCKHCNCWSLMAGKYPRNAYGLLVVRLKLSGCWDIRQYGTCCFQLFCFPEALVHDFFASLNAAQFAQRVSLSLNSFVRGLNLLCTGNLIEVFILCWDGPVELVYGTTSYRKLF